MFTFKSTFLPCNMTACNNCNMPFALPKLRPGLFLALLGAFGYTMDYILIAFVIDGIGSEIPTAVRYICQAYVCSPILFISKDWLETTRKDMIFMVINGILLGFLTFLSLLSVRFIPPVDTTGIFGAEPVFVLFIGYFVLKEKFGKFEVVVTFAMFTGILLVCQPQFIFGHSESGYNQLIGIGLSLASTLLLSIVDCMCRMLKLSDGMFLSLIQAMGAVLFTLVALGFRMTQMPTPYQWMYIFGAGVAGCTGRISVTFAMKFEKASYISSVVAVEVILTVILQIFILGVYPNTLSISGSVLVATCIVLLSFRVQIVDKLEKIFCSSSNAEPLTDSLQDVTNDRSYETI